MGNPNTDCCCNKIPGCLFFCSLTNKCVCKWADDNRKMLCYFNCGLTIIALVLAIVAICGLSMSTPTLLSVPWLTADVDFTTTLLSASGTETSYSFKYYANIVGITATNRKDMTLTYGGDTYILNKDDQTTTFPVEWTELQDTFLCSVAGNSTACSGNCKDATDGLYSKVIIAVITGVLHIYSSLKRRNRETDSSWAKCPGYVSLIPIALTLNVLATYKSACMDDLQDASNASNVEYGAGWWCYLFSLLLGNVPAFIINFIIPVPDHEDCCDEECEGDGESSVVAKV